MLIGIYSSRRKKVGDSLMNLGFCSYDYCYRRLIYKSHFIFKLEADNNCLLGENDFPSLKTPDITFSNFALARSKRGKFSDIRMKKGCRGRVRAVR